MRRALADRHTIDRLGEVDSPRRKQALAAWLAADGRDRQWMHVEPESSKPVAMESIDGALAEWGGLKLAFER